MILRENINKIHYSLKETFENVTLEEKDSKSTGKYFLISAVKENKQIKLKVSFRELEHSKFVWMYLENPLNENSQWIERYSSVNTLLSDISDVFNKNRFSEDYLKSIK